MPESLEEFKIRRDSTTDCGVSCPLALEKIPLTYERKNGVATFSQLFLIGSFSYLQVRVTYIRAWMSPKLGQIQPRTTELPALERLKIHVATFSWLFFIRSLSYSQVMMTCMRAQRSSKFGQVRPLTAEIAALEGLKKNP